MYESFSIGTRSVKHGKFAQCWMLNNKMIHLYHEFIRSIRTGDLELYIYCLPKIVAFFFAFNHQSYARWLTIYHDNLLKIQETHPQVHKEFKSGYFALKCTSKSFSRIPIDLTNDATCQRRGILNLTSSIAARQRWVQSHYSLKTRKEDASEEIKLHRIKHECKDLEKLLDTIIETMNPFSSTIDKDHLFNISTGKAANDETSDYLLNVESIGSRSKDIFIGD